MGILDYLATVFDVIWRAMTLQRSAVDVLLESGMPNLVVAGVAILCGISMLLGQSAILFLNQVRPARFVLSLVLNGLFLLVGALIWAAVVWLVGNLLFEIRPPFIFTLQLIILAESPFILGCLILIPWLGPGLARVLHIWSFLIALIVVMGVFRVAVLPALLCVGLGWLAMYLLNMTIGRPISVLGDAIRRLVAGSKLDMTPQGVLEAVRTGKLPDRLVPPPGPGGGR